MATIKLPYGKKSFNLDLKDDEILTVVNAHEQALSSHGAAAAVRSALDKPVGSPRLGDMVRPGEKICILVPDVTRLWQSPSVSVPLIVEELNNAGIKDEDIVVLCATGTHRRMTDEEHAALLGSEIMRRIKVVDHQCGENEFLKELGRTSRGTPVAFNTHAVEADKIISVCGVCYHFLAGFGGGAKMLLPGIAGMETIQHNHKLALNPGFGKGHNPEVRSGNMSESNPFHADQLEGAEMLPPAFALNVVVDDSFRIIKAFAGDWKKSHLEACRLVAQLDGVSIPEHADFVIASAGGSPKDINLYQGIKLLSNAMAAAKPGATIIMLAQCPEGFGNEGCRSQICDFDNMEAREKALRDNFSIGSYVGFLLAQAGEQYRLILVTDMPSSDFAKTAITVVQTLEAALDLTKDMAGKPAIVMPHGASTLPIPENEKRAAGK